MTCKKGEPPYGNNYAAILKNLKDRGLSPTSNPFLYWWMKDSFTESSGLHYQKYYRTNLPVSLVTSLAKSPTDNTGQSCRVYQTHIISMSKIYGGANDFRSNGISWCFQQRRPGFKSPLPHLQCVKKRG